MARNLSFIAAEIDSDWGLTKSGVYFGARPYLDAMYDLDEVSDMYGLDDGRTIVMYFLANANGWRGETARRVKAELKGML